MWSCWPRKRRSLSDPPSPSLPPLTRCRAGDWMWSRWPRETKSLSSPSSPLLTLAKRMTGRAGKQGRYPPPSPFPHLTRVTGCSRAGRVKQGRYHPPSSAAWVAGDLPPPSPSPLPPLVTGRAGLMDDCVKQGRSHPPPFPPPVPRGWLETFPPLPPPLSSLSPLS